MAIFLTGSTGYIGAHIASNLLADHRDPLNLLVRARDQDEARSRLWRSLQLHMDEGAFEDMCARGSACSSVTLPIRGLA